MYMDNIQIISFKANIDSIGGTLNLIDSIKDDDEIIQLLNANSIVSKDHIIHGVNQAFLAFDRGENLANDISVEIVLRCSAQRQISKAFDMMGVPLCHSTLVLRANPLKAEGQPGPAPAQPRWPRSCVYSSPHTGGKGAAEAGVSARFLEIINLCPSPSSLFLPHFFPPG